MDQETFENYDVDADTLGDDAKYLKDGLDVHAVMFEERVVAIQLPPKVQYKVTDAPPAVKGDTATGREPSREEHRHRQRDRARVQRGDL